MHWAMTSPSLGVYVTTSSRGVEPKWRRSRYVTKSAPARTRRRPPQIDVRLFSNSNPSRQPRPPSLSASQQRAIRPPPSNMVSIEDVFNLAENTREKTSLENRRHVMEEARKAIRHETLTLDFSRPQSGVGQGLQAMTSPMPISARDNSKSNHMDHIPALLPLPSDRTFVPSPDHDNHRHLTTPVEDLAVGETSQSVARQCCEIMGASRCRTCRKLESRMLNREKADRECPRMLLSHQNISMTQIVKRSYPSMSEDDIKEKIVRGEIARSRFPHNHRWCHHAGDMDEEENVVDDGDNEMRDKATSVSESDSTTKTAIEKNKVFSTPEIRSTSTNPIYLLAKLSMKLKGEPTTPLFFSNLKTMQSKILSGEVERKTYMNKPVPLRLKSAVSIISNASSGKSTLSKVGAKLSESLMPVFVSPRKVKIIEEPKYKVFYEPPLLEKRKQIPNPSFFAGSDCEYSLPERLPDVIEFADSNKILAMEKLARSTSSMSFTSNISEDLLDQDRMSSSMEKSGDLRSGSHSARVDRPSSGQTGEGHTTPRTVRVSTEGTLGRKVVQEEDEFRHAEEEKKSEKVLEDGEKNKIVEERQENIKSKNKAESTQTKMAAGVQSTQREGGNVETRLLATENTETRVSDTENMETRAPDTENIETRVPDIESMVTRVPDTESMVTRVPDTENMETRVPAVENTQVICPFESNVAGGDKDPQTMDIGLNYSGQTDTEKCSAGFNDLCDEDKARHGESYSSIDEKDEMPSQEHGKGESEERNEGEEFVEIDAISFSDESLEEEEPEVDSGSEDTCSNSNNNNDNDCIEAV